MAVSTLTRMCCSLKKKKNSENSTVVSAEKN